MNRRCPDQEQLAEFVSGQLSEMDATSLAQHLESCPECSATAKGLSSNTVLKTPKPDATDYVPSTNLVGINDVLVDLKRGAGKVEIGTELRNYVIEDLIAESGMGVVYKARHKKLGQLLALKVLKPQAMSDPAVVERFHQEVAASGKLEHPNIVLARDADEVDGVHFLVMELVDGTDLHSLVKRHGPMSVANASEVIRQSAIALQHVADNEMVHRDIKPSNLMLTRSGQVKMLDLGLAKLREEHDDQHTHSITSTGQIMGTVDFMSPEQATDSRTADIRADIYSLGCTLYYLLVGKAPFRRDGHIKTLMAHAQDTPPELPNRVPLGLKQLYLDMLQKEPDGRPQPPGEIADLLAEFTDGHSLSDIATDQTRVDQASANTETTSLSPSVVEARSRPKGPLPKKEPDSVPARPPTRNRRRLWTVAACLPILFGLGVVINIATDKGDVRIEIANDIKEQVTVDVLRDDEPYIKGWSVTSEDKQRRVRSGRISVKLPEELANKLTFAFKNDKAEMTRGGEVVVRISRKIATEPPSLDPSPKVQTAFDVVRDAGRDVWLPGDDAGNLVGLTPLPAKLASGERWQVETTSPRGSIYDLKWSPNGEYLAIGSEDGFLRVYQLKDRSLKLVRCFGEAHEKAIIHISWSRDSEKVLAIPNQWESSIRVYDVDTGTLAAATEVSGQIIGAAFSPIDDSILLGFRGGLYTWKPDFGNPATDVRPGLIVKKSKLGPPFTALCWDASGEQILVGHEGGSVSIYAVSGERLRENVVARKRVDRVLWRGNEIFAFDRQAMRSFRIEPASLEVIEDIEGGVWERLDGAKTVVLENRNIRNHRTARLRIASGQDEQASPQYQYLGEGEGLIAKHPVQSIAAIATNGVLQLFDTAVEQIKSLQQFGTDRSMNAASWSTNGTEFCTRVHGHDAYVWTATGKLRTKVPIDIRDAYVLCWAPDGNALFYSGFVGNGARTYRVSTRGEKTTQLSNSACISVSNDGQWIASSKSGGAIEITDIRTGAVSEIPTDEQGIRQLVFSPNAAYIAAQTNAWSWQIFERSSGKKLELPREYWRDFDWSPDSTGFFNTDLRSGEAVSLAGKTLWTRKLLDREPHSHANQSQSTISNDKVVTWLRAQLVIQNLASGEELARVKTNCVPQEWSGTNRVDASSDGAHLSTHATWFWGPTNIWNLETRKPEWFCLDVSKDLAVSFTSAGQMIEPTAEKASHFCWVVERKNGARDILTRDEFLTLKAGKPTAKKTIDTSESIPKSVAK